MKKTRVFRHASKRGCSRLFVANKIKFHYYKNEFKNNLNPIQKFNLIKQKMRFYAVKFILMAINRTGVDALKMTFGSLIASVRFLFRNL